MKFSLPTIVFAALLLPATDAKWFGKDKRQLMNRWLNPSIGIIH